MSTWRLPEATQCAERRDSNRGSRNRASKATLIGPSRWLPTTPGPSEVYATCLFPPPPPFPRTPHSPLDITKKVNEAFWDRDYDLLIDLPLTRYSITYLCRAVMYTPGNNRDAQEQSRGAWVLSWLTACSAVKNDTIGAAPAEGRGWGGRPGTSTGLASM